MRLKIIPQITITRKPRNKGDKTKFKFALEITIKRANNPRRG